MDILEGLLKNFQDPAFMRNEWLAIAEIFGYASLAELRTPLGVLTVVVVAVCAIVWGIRHGWGFNGGTVFILVMGVVSITFALLKMTGQWVLSLTMILAIITAWLF